MPRHREKHILVSITGAFFYMIVVIEWLWSILPYLPGIVQFAGTLQPPAKVPFETTAHVAASNQPSIMLIVTATIAVIAATIYTLLKLPATVGRAGEKFTKTASEYIVPVVSHHIKLTPKKRQWLTQRIVLDVKLALCILPIVVAAFCYLVAASLPYDIVMFIAAGLSMSAIVLLCIQLLLAKWLNVSPLSQG